MMVRSIQSGGVDKQKSGYIDNTENLESEMLDDWTRLEQRVCAQLALHERRIVHEFKTLKQAVSKTLLCASSNRGVQKQREASLPVSADALSDSSSDISSEEFPPAESGFNKGPRRTSRLTNFLREFRITDEGEEEVTNSFSARFSSKRRSSSSALTTHSSEVQNLQRWSGVIEGDGINEESSSNLVNWSRNLLKNRWFDYLIAFLISVNSYIVAADADWAVQKPTTPKPEAFRAIDIAITGMFSIELTIRIIAEGKRFVSIHNRHLRWNVLDFFFVTSAVVDEICRQLAFVIVDVSFIRIVRVFRLVRVVRIVRVVRFFKDLRIMIASVVRSIQSLVWALLLLVMLAFMFATFILEFVATEIQALEADGDERRIAILKFHFGSLWTTMFTLFKAITNGVDWGEPAAALIEISPFLGLMFALYVAFATMCVMNIIIGIFVENSSMSALKDEQTLLLECLDEKNHWQDEVLKLFNQLGGNDWITYKEFESRITDLNVQARIRKLGLEVEPHAMLGLFDILDYDRTGFLSKEDFVLGLRMLHGNAKSIDIARLLHDNGRIRHELKEIRGMLGCHR
eukprot:TRINITY_DN4521_c0_g1_i3.p1 TRINITY_DN4521_c0_g1~~TRINITY_DN4521_c0_g1_i3.p1  ORF type:complete len:640 (+),score=74.85 TRINITY_DN4521_c0_g1_i3:202-1920(+)